MKIKPKKILGMSLIILPVLALVAVVGYMLVGWFIVIPFASVAVIVVTTMLGVDFMTG